MNEFKELQNVVRTTIEKTVAATGSNGIYVIRIPADFCVNINESRTTNDSSEKKHKKFDLRLETSENRTDDFWEIRIRIHK